MELLVSGFVIVKSSATSQEVSSVSLWAVLDVVWSKQVQGHLQTGAYAPFDTTEQIRLSCPCA